MRVALAGNPNSGKTTLFNALTGSNQYVGNWPGVTVEKKGGKLKADKSIEITDLPGIYSLSPYTLEEVVARNFLIDVYKRQVLESYENVPPWRLKKCSGAYAVLERRVSEIDLSESSGEDRVVGWFKKGDEVELCVRK